MADYSQHRVAQLRQMLVEEHGYTEEEANAIKGKRNVVELLESIDSDNQKMSENEEESMADLVDFEKDFEEEKNIAKTNKQTEDIPSMADPGWSDYVMKQFVKDELKDGNPTVDGLRRVASKLLGAITSVVPNVIQSPDASNEGRATVTVQVTFEDTTTFGGCADVHWRNTQKPYSDCPVATADTRAEGRALRRALQLRKVLAAEEVVVTDAMEDKEPIQGNQINFLRLWGDRCGVNIEKMAAQLGFENRKILRLTRQDAVQLVEQLNKYQQGEEVPEELAGYSSNWEPKT